MPKSTQRKISKNRVKTMKKQIIKPPTNKRGIIILIEPMPTVTNQPSLKGDVIKKYVNGKLVKQIFVSEKKVKCVMKKISDKYKRYGGSTIENPQNIKLTNEQTNGQVKIADGTTFWQSLKTGFGSGLGFGAAFEAIKWLFGSDKSSTDEDEVVEDVVE